MAIKRPDEYVHNNSDLAIVDSAEVRGGLKYVADEDAMINIPQDKLKRGILCYRIDLDRWYKLDTDPSSAGSAASWSEFSAGGTSVTGSLVYKGAIDASGPASQLDDAQLGWFYIIDTAGTFLGTTFTVGDHLVVNQNITGTPASNAVFDHLDYSNDNAVLKTNMGPGVKYDNSNNHLTLDLDSLPLVAPSMTITWTLTKADSSPYTLKSGALSDTSITVDNGVRAEYTARYRWTATSGYKDPTAVSGDWNGVQPTLPASGVTSAALTDSNITSNDSKEVTLSAAASGLNVSAGKVVFATGNDTTSGSIGVTFRDTVYFGNSTSTSLTATAVKLLSNSKFGDKSETYTGVSASGGEYVYFAYPESLGNLTNIIMDGAAPVLGAFSKIGTVTLTNDGGISVSYNVYRSNATNAFTNNTLAFS